MWPFGARKLTIDPAHYDPDAAQLRAWLTNRDWPRARDFLNTVTDEDDRAFYLDVCGEVPGLQEWIRDWIAAEPESTLPLLVRGYHGVSWAWEARGSARAKYTSQEAFQLFFRRLKMAEDCLDEVTERNPDEVAAWAKLVVLARGRQVDSAEAERRFQQAVARCPHHLTAHEQMLQYHCRKWSGSHEKMFAFARSAAAKAPGGSLLPELVVVAHLEMWLDLSGPEERSYFDQAEVRQELREAAEASIWHPKFRKRPGWPSRFNTFAMGFSQAKDHSAASPIFEEIGDRMTEWPWCYNLAPQRAFLQARREARDASRR